MNTILVIMKPFTEDFTNMGNGNAMFLSGQIYLIYEKTDEIIFCFPYFLFSISLSAQQLVSDTSSVIVHKDPRLDLLVKKQIQINEETTREARRVAKGFGCLLSILTTGMKRSLPKQKYTVFSRIKILSLYQSPYYKLKAGNFKERKDAEEYQKKLKRIFPRAFLS